MVKVTNVCAAIVSEVYWRLREREELALRSVRVAAGGGKRTLSDLGYYCGIHSYRKDELMRPIYCLDNCECERCIQLSPQWPFGSMPCMLSRFSSWTHC